MTESVCRLFGDASHPGFSALWSLNLENSRLNSTDLASINLATSKGNLPALEKLHLPDNTLTNSLAHLLGHSNHLGYPSLLQLNLSNTGLSKADMQTISDSAEAGKLPKLQRLNISNNNLADCIRNLVGGQNHPGYSSLVDLDLQSTQLCKADVKCLLRAIRDGKFPTLKALPDLPAALTGLLDDIFSISGHRAFPYRENLSLANRQLSEGDLKSVCRALRDNRLNGLRELDLSFNILTNYVEELFDCEFTSLRILDMTNTQLAKVDIRCLVKAIDSRKLPRLAYLKLSGNILTDSIAELLNCQHQYLEGLVLNKAQLNKDNLSSFCEAAHDSRIPALRRLCLSGNILTNSLENLLGDVDKKRFPLLEVLVLNKAQLNKDDLSSLCEAAHDGTLSALRGLCLSGNILTNSLENLLGDAGKKGFPLLKYLCIKNTQLSNNDLVFLVEKFKSNKLPKLESLNLEQNNLCSMENEVESLVQACAATHRYKRFIVYLTDNDLPEDFLTKLKSFCENTLVQLESKQ